VAAREGSSAGGEILLEKKQQRTIKVADHSQLDIDVVSEEKKDEEITEIWDLNSYPG